MTLLEPWTFLQIKHFKSRNRLRLFHLCVHMRQMAYNEPATTFWFLYLYHILYVLYIKLTKKNTLHSWVTIGALLCTIQAWLSRLNGETVESRWCLWGVGVLSFLWIWLTRESKLRHKRTDKVRWRMKRQTNQRGTPSEHWQVDLQLSHTYTWLFQCYLIWYCVFYCYFKKIM